MFYGSISEEFFVMFDLILSILSGVSHWLSSISVVGVSLFDWIVGFVLFGLIVSFLRGGSND